MKEKHFCRCCLSVECYKDMANTYYIGSKTENYFEMLLNIFSINIINDEYAERCLICEECVSKLRDAAAFKKKVLDINEIIKNNICWETNGTVLDAKIEDEDADYFDDFGDNVSDKDFIWENFIQDGSQKGQVFVITLESNGETQKKHKNISKFKKSKSYKLEIEKDESTNKNLSTLGAKIKNKVINSTTLGAIEKDKGKNSNTPSGSKKDEVENINILAEILNDSENFNTLHTKGDDSDDMDIEGLGSEEDFDIAKNSKSISKSSPPKRNVKTKAGTVKQNKDKLNKPKSTRREYSQTELSLKHKSENTLKLVQNSNLCLFRSLRNKFGCNYCPSKFPECSQLREHLLTHKNPAMLHIKRLRGLSFKNAEITDLKCSLCSENCSDLQSLTEHLKKEHEITFHGTGHYLVPYKLQDGYQCVLCELKFNSYLRLSVHMNSHYTNNVCESCGISFINRIGLRAHVQSQHKEKKCSRCPAIFMTVSAKSKHLRQIHGIRNTKRYCNICNKTFKYTYMLNEHKIQEHGVKRPAVSSCVECGKFFSSSLNLKTHMRSVHIKERNYPCTKCGIRFFTTCDQKRHERTHEDVRSFCCSYCDAKFKSKDSWRRHLKRQHGHVFGEATSC